MDTTGFSYEETMEHLSLLANESLELWDLPAGSKARLINVSENETFLVEAPDGFKSILRIHREDYHTETAIACEHAWSRSLNEEGGVKTPNILPGRNGSTIQSATSTALGQKRYLAMFEFVEGSEPDQQDDLTGGFEELGEIAAKTHLHSIDWERPEPFERLVWDLDTVFGKEATWGNWRDGPNIGQQTREVLEKVEATVIERLTRYGRGTDRFGLIHADMRLANLLITKGETRLIDFDDCGFGWLMYDFAAGISFMEDDPRIPELKQAWVRGYRSVRPLSEEDEAEIPTFVMMRRLALLAWIGSHSEVDIAKELAPTFAPVSEELGRNYLASLA
ncbi:MAG: phosphotransferase [Pseudomonadota bacterium]|nr:phosphotransferase [Pseudomonadota bacterium]MED5249945.1 phosphotransferase [Pseudomonadota bacterium]